MGSHRMRTFLAGIAGTLAVYLLLTSITAVWLNRTLIDTPTFVGTVAPLATKPAVQQFIAKVVTNGILDSTPPEQIVAALPVSARPVIIGLAGDQLKAVLAPVVSAQVLHVVQAPGFGALWTSTLTSAHRAILRQLNSGNRQDVVFDVTPAVDGVLAQLKTTELGPVITQANIPSDIGKVTIPSRSFAGAYRYYRQFRAWTVLAVIGAIGMGTIAVVLSVNHGKTIRRILLAGGMLALLQGTLLALPWLVTIPHVDTTTEAAVKIIVEQIVRNLMLLSFIVGIACISGAVISAVISHMAKPRSQVSAAPKGTPKKSQTAMQ